MLCVGGAPMSGGLVIYEIFDVNLVVYLQIRLNGAESLMPCMQLCPLHSLL